MMTKEKELLDLCNYIVSIGLKAGANAVEVLAQSQNDLETNIELSEINSVNQKIGTEIAIRLFIGKRMGCAFTNIPTKESVANAVDLAIAASKVTTEDEEWVSFPQPNKYCTIKDLWHDDVVNTNPSYVVNLTSKLILAASKSEPGLIVVGGGSGTSSFTSAYANSNGVTHSESGTSSFLVEVAMAQVESGATPMVFEYDVRRDLSLNLETVVRRVADQIRICKIKAKGKTGKYTVVFHPQAYSQILEYTLMQGVRGDNVARGKSKIADKIGDTIASELFTLCDDGIIPGGAVTSIADDEGVPRQRTPIIEKGVLRSFLWDTYWANKMGVKSTGNAKRNMRQGLVDISPTTLVINPGTREIQEILEEIDYGFYILNVQGAHSSNPESGDFSIVGNPAFLIEHGKLIGAVDGLMVSGNIFEVLKNIVEIAKTPVKLFSWIGPEFVAKEINITAKG
jgi:PmbA protein